MAKYLTKEIILAAYKKLRWMVPDPKKHGMQGQTQRVSALRHLVALDEFKNTRHRNCNTTDSVDRGLYAKMVGDVVRIYGDLYTANFYDDLKVEGDYNTGSNLYSANVVRISLDNPNGVYDYPRRRGMSPVFKVQNGSLLIGELRYSSLRDYLYSEDLRCAFLVWLLRNSKFSNDASNESFHHALNSAICSAGYSSDLRDAIVGSDFYQVDYLIPETVAAFCGSKAQLTKEMIESTWKGSVSYQLIDLYDGVEPAGLGVDQNLSIQYIDGNPLGIKVCRNAASQLVSIVVPRPFLSRAKEAGVFPNRGIYYLFRQTNKGLVKGYAGQTRQGLHRIDDHNSRKDWWNLAVLHLAPDAAMNLDVVNRLEAQAIEQLIAASIKCDNKVGNNTKTSSTGEAEAMQVFREIQFRMQALGLLIR